MIMTIPTSIGDVADRLTILLIKQKHITDTDKQANITKEYDLLDREFRHSLQEASVTKGVELLQLMASLQTINQAIWNVEDDIRDHERRKLFDADFIELARNVYIFNDRRAVIKRQINDLFGSTIKEEKSYKEYQ